MKKLKRGKNAKALEKELFLMMLPYKNFVHSITSDNGSEFYEHKKIAQKLNVEYYFAHPYSSWERGLNEYTVSVSAISSCKDKFIVLPLRVKSKTDSYVTRNLFHRCYIIVQKSIMWFVRSPNVPS